METLEAQNGDEKTKTEDAAPAAQAAVAPASSDVVPSDAVDPPAVQEPAVQELEKGKKRKWWDEDEASKDELPKGSHNDELPRLDEGVKEDQRLKEGHGVGEDGGLKHARVKEDECLNQDVGQKEDQGPKGEASGSNGWEEKTPEVEMPEEVKGALHHAAEAREDLVIQWREVCKPRRAGAVAAQRKGSRKDFASCFNDWLRARNLQDALAEVGYKDGWKIYRYLREPKVKSEENWEQAFHGTWWYSVWLVLASGVFLESNDRDKGHDFWEPGVYCSPLLSTARWYARPHILFADGVYHRIIFELRVNTEKRLRNRQRGGVQWVFKPDAVSLYGVWVQRNAPPVVGEERINNWDPKLEARPYDAVEVDATTNVLQTCRPVDQPFSDTEEDEPGEEDVEAPPPPHLMASNSLPLGGSVALPPARGGMPPPPALFSRLSSSSNPYAKPSSGYGYAGGLHGVANGGNRFYSSGSQSNGSYAALSGLPGVATWTRPPYTPYSPPGWGSGGRSAPRKRFNPVDRSGKRMHRMHSDYSEHRSGTDDPFKEPEAKGPEEPESGKACMVEPMKSLAMLRALQQQNQP